MLQLPHQLLHVQMTLDFDTRTRNGNLAFGLATLPLVMIISVRRLKFMMLAQQHVVYVAEMMQASSSEQIGIRMKTVCGLQREVVEKTHTVTKTQLK